MARKNRRAATETPEKYPYLALLWSLDQPIIPRSFQLVKLMSRNIGGRPTDRELLSFLEKSIEKADLKARNYATLVKTCTTINTLTKWRATNYIRSQHRDNVMFCPKLAESWTRSNCRPPAGQDEWRGDLTLPHIVWATHKKSESGPGSRCIPVALAEHDAKKSSSVIKTWAHKDKSKSHANYHFKMNENAVVSMAGISKASKNGEVLAEQIAQKLNLWIAGVPDIIHSISKDDSKDNGKSNKVSTEGSSHRFKAVRRSRGGSARDGKDDHHQLRVGNV